MLLCYVLILVMLRRCVMWLCCNVTLLLCCYVVMLRRCVAAMLMDSMRGPNLVVMVLLYRCVGVVLLCCYIAMLFWCWCVGALLCCYVKLMHQDNNTPAA